MLEHPRNICTLFLIVVGTYVALCYLYDLWILWTLIYRNVTTFVRNYRKSTSETWLKLYLFPPQTNISSKRWSFLNPEMILFFVISWFLFCLCETHTDFYFILFFFWRGGPRRLDFTVFVRFRWLLRRVICEVMIYLIFQIHVPNKADITSQHITSDLNRLRTSANTHIFPVVEQVRDWRTYCMLFVCLFAF